MMKKNNSSRSSRKLAHIKHTLELSAGPGTTGMEDVHLVHSCLPELAWEEIDISTSFLGLSFSSPIIINAMTGGSNDVTWINRGLARAAAATGLAMAVGSQTAALENRSLADSFQVVRAENPKGLIFANIGANATPADAVSAIEMINADALQIHLNVAQEIVMPEGDRDFRGLLENIQAVVNKVSVPVIVKEVGFGIDRDSARRLNNCGVTGFDIGGRGGTNFIAIEQARRRDQFGCGIINWGIPTAASLIEVASSLMDRDAAIIASGGLSTSMDIAKSLALGAGAIGIAAPFLKILLENGRESDLIEHIFMLNKELKAIMLLVGADSIATMKHKPVVITGFIAEWLQARGIMLSSLASR